MRIAQVFAAVALAFAFPGCQTTHDLPQGQLVGEPMQAVASHRFSVVDAEPAKFFDKTVLVEATVQSVCPTKGCWMIVEDQGKVARVRWEAGCGGQYAFPLDSVGKRVLIQGSFYPKTLSAADAEHMEEDAGGKVAIPRGGHEINASSVLILEPAT